MAVDNNPVEKIGSRTAFLLPNTGGAGRTHEPHLHICVTAPDKDGKVLCVPVGSYEDGMDNTCLLNKGDHDYVNKPSMIYYGHAKIMQASTIVQKINGKKYEHWEDVKQEVFARITKGVLSSGHIKPVHRNYARLQWN